MNIRMTIPKNRDNSGTAILYIVGTSVFISSGQRIGVHPRRAPVTIPSAPRRRVQHLLGGLQLAQLGS
jgi:hypothetical protein